MAPISKIVLLALFLGSFANGVRAQWIEQQPNDYYQRSLTWEQRPQELTYVREADVYWGKLLWRIIDVREKENQYFYFPVNPEGVRGRKNLAYVLWDAILAGEIELFEDDELKIPLDCAKVIDRATRSDTVQMEVYDSLGMMVMAESFDMWIYPKCKNGYARFFRETEFMGTVPLFWVPMLSLQTRVLLAKKEAYCAENYVHLPTWEYVFNSFMYSSFITREDNVWNRAIHDYLTGEDAILESQRIEEEIMNISLDMWEY